jgi:hypothetical protein
MPTKILTAKDFEEQEEPTVLSLKKSDVRPRSTAKKIAPGDATSTVGTTQEQAGTVATSKKKKKKKKKNRGEASLELAIAKPGKVGCGDFNDGFAGDKEGVSKTLKTVTCILELISKSFPLFGAR